MLLPSPDRALLGLACALLAVVALFDLRERRIPNALVIALLASGLVRGAVAGWHGALTSALGVVVGFAALLWPYSKGWMGAGDVKLLAAIGAWLGLQGTLVALVFGSLLGGVLAVVALARLGRTEQRSVGHNLLNAALLRGLEVPEPSELSKARGIPFGVSLSLVSIGLLVARSVS